MKNLTALFFLLLLLDSCSTTGKLANEAIHHAIVGQNEKIIYNRLGKPARTETSSEGEKILVYEFQSKGMYTTPNKSNLTVDYSGDMGNSAPHLNWQYSRANTQTNSTEYTIYQKDISVLQVFLNKEGNCTRIQHNLTKDQLEYFYGSFSKYIPKD
ncbi:hypothetical protein [Maribellus sp. YY47]|uniref:hypothetical protein n=1 Tax=Maribellus sp. YY47 TaxID=2929486 RepID=UPI0020006C9C|nr:hypothetical protein [Maribellus sp. YY47]MCK3684177.1 hypothetical protein [Maribellus sp. YY47]